VCRNDSGRIDIGDYDRFDLGDYMTYVGTVGAESSPNTN
jgi:hypothetical protein